MLSQKELNEFSVGDEFTMFLIVTKCEVKTAINGKLFLYLELSDKSLALPSKVWDNAEDYAKKLKEGTIVKVAGAQEDKWLAVSVDLLHRSIMVRLPKESVIRVHSP